MHGIDRDWLRRQLAEPFDGATVVVTHHAPSMGSLDPDDISHSFGGASEPAVLVEAIYLSSDDKVKFANKVDVKLARVSTNVTAIITATNMRFAGPAKARLRAALSPDCAFRLQACTQAALAPFWHERIAMFRLISEPNLVS